MNNATRWGFSEPLKGDLVEQLKSMSARGLSEIELDFEEECRNCDERLEVSLRGYRAPTVEEIETRKKKRDQEEAEQLRRELRDLKHLFEKHGAPK
jgi:hypothetical protein